MTPLAFASDTWRVNGKDPRITGARIARRRQVLDLTQDQLAERLGVSPSTVANWERGVSYPSKKLGKVEAVLGITLRDDDHGLRPDPWLVDQVSRLTPAQRLWMIEWLTETLSRRGEGPAAAREG